MKKVVRVFASVVLVLSVLTATNAFALQNSGEYMFTLPGNDPSSPAKDQEELERVIESWFLNVKGVIKDVELEFYAKVDQGSPTTTEGFGDLTLTYENGNSDSGKWGTWETEEAIDFYSVKAGRGYAVYWVDPSATAGTWNTGDRYGKDISHLSTWKNVGGGISVPPTDVSVPPADPSAVPEPSTVLLLGIGLIGLLAVRRKRF
jgi:hypothetical protein